MFRFRQKCLPLKEMLLELGRVFVRTQEIITWARLESRCPLVASERDFVEGHLAVTTNSQIGKPGQDVLYVEPGRKLVLDIHGSYLRCHESPPTTGCWQVTRAWLDLAWQTLRDECPLFTESKKLRSPTLRQLPGRPDVAIKLSLALEKLTFLCEV